MNDSFEPAPQATRTVEPRFQAAQASPAVLSESSASEDVSTILAGVEDSDGAGLRKRKVWSFPRYDEQKPEREPLTEEDWARVLNGKHHTMVFLVTREQREWAGSQARSCGTCTHVNLNGDPRRGFCVAQKMMTGLTFPVLCREWIAS